MSKQIFRKQADLVKALAHPSRLEIVHLLRSHSLTVTQMAKMLGRRQAFVSQHLLVLRHADIVAATRDGKEIYYAITDPCILTACDNLYSHVASSDLPDSPEPTVIDPICGMKLTPGTASYVDQYNGVRHYFCGKGCLKEFHGNH